MTKSKVQGLGEAPPAEIPADIIEQRQIERDRQKAEFRWQANTKVIKDKLAMLDMSAITLTNLSKELTQLFDSYGTVKGKHIVDKDTPVQLINGVDTADLTLGEFILFIRKKANNPNYIDNGISFVTLSITKFNDNPFLHPLAKSLGIKQIDEDWLESHSFISVENYNKISKGEAVTAEVGFWNTDLSKAIEEIGDYKKEKKMIYENSKIIILSLYSKEIPQVKEAII